MSIAALNITALNITAVFSALVFLNTFYFFYIPYNINNNYVYGQEYIRFSPASNNNGSDSINKENAFVHSIDTPLEITVLEKENNRTDTDILNSRENYRLTSDAIRKQQEFKTGFCGINSTATGFSEYVVEYTLPQDCEMPLAIVVDSEDNEVWYVSTKRGLLGKYDINNDKFEQYLIPHWKVRDDPRGFSQVWDMKIDNEKNGSSDIWFTDTAQNAIWRFKKSTEQFEMYKIPAQSESFGTTYPITINVVTNKSDNDNNDKSIFFIGTFFPSLWFAEIDKLKNDTANGIHEIQLPTEYGFSNIDPLYVTSGSFAFDEDRNSVWISMLSYTRKGQIFEYNLDSKSFNVFGLPDDLSSPLGIVVGDDDDGDDDDQEDKPDLWVTNPGTSTFYNFELNEQEVIEGDGDVQTMTEERDKEISSNVNIEKYTTSMASPRIFGRSFYDYNNSNETEGDDLRSKYYTLPSWIKKASDGSIWFNQQQGNKIARFDPSEKLLVEYWIPSQNKEWGSCDSKEEDSTNKNNNMTRGCGIANVLNFALKESNKKGDEDEDERNTVEEVWFTEWATNKIGRINTEKDLPFNIEIFESDEELTIKRGESENIKMILTTNEEFIENDDKQSKGIGNNARTELSRFSDLATLDNLITTTAAGTFTSTGYLGNSTGYFDIPVLSFDQDKNGDGEQEVSFVFIPSKDMTPGDYVLMLGAENKSVSVLKAVKITVI